MRSSKTLFNIFVSSLLLAISLMVSVMAKASFAGSWGLGAGTGSYMGQRHFFVSYTSENRRHQTDFGYGFTEGKIGSDIEQVNIKYTYSPFRYSFGDLKTNILGAGFILNRWQSSEAFWESPDQYPETHYYGQTLRRVALVFTQKWSYYKWEAYIDWALMDYVLIAVYNNESYRNKIEIFGGGFGLRYRF